MAVRGWCDGRVVSMGVAVSVAFAAAPERPRWPIWEALARTIAVVLRDHGSMPFRRIMDYLPDDRGAVMNAVAWLDLQGWAVFDHVEAKAWGLTEFGRAAIRRARASTLQPVQHRRRTCSGNPRGKRASGKTLADCETAASWIADHPWSSAGDMWRARVFNDRRTLDYTLGYLSRKARIVSRKARFFERNLYAIAGTKPPSTND